MAKIIQNITDDPYQSHIIKLEDSEIELKLRFMPKVASWFADFDSIKGVRLSVGVRFLKAHSKDYDFICRDMSDNGIDPFRVDDFSSGRCELYLLEPDDVETLRLGGVLT